MTDEARGRGRTTGQMRAAPPGAWFVWPYASSMGYAHALARRLGRGDLTIVAAREAVHRIRGLEVDVVVDHATWDMVDRDTFKALEFGIRCHSLGRSAAGRQPA